MNFEILAAIQSTAIQHGTGNGRINNHEILCRNVKGRARGSRGGFSLQWYCDGERISYAMLKALAGRCPHGLQLDDNTCGPCSKGKPMRDGVNVVRGRDIRSEEQGDKIAMFNAEY